MVPVFKNAREMCTAKNYRSVSPLSVVSKVFEKLVNNRLVDHLQKYGVFSHFQYGFRPYQFIIELLYIIELLGLSIGLGLLALQHVLHPKLLRGFGTLVFFTNLSLMEFQII